MKRTLCTICLVLASLVSGCGCTDCCRVWYKPGGTLEDALQASLICEQRATMLDIPVTDTGCMKRLGYRRLPKEQLPAGTRVCKTGYTLGNTCVAGK